MSYAFYRKFAWASRVKGLPTPRYGFKPGSWPVTGQLFVNVKATGTALETIS